MRAGRHSQIPIAFERVKMETELAIYSESYMQEKNLVFLTSWCDNSEFHIILKLYKLVARDKNRKVAIIEGSGYDGKRAFAVAVNDVTERKYLVRKSPK